MELQSALTCPECGHVEVEIMPTDACQFFHHCKGCKAVLKSNAGDCRVYCSFGSVACPPILTLAFLSANSCVNLPCRMTG